MSENAPKPANPAESMIWRQFKKRKIGLVSLVVILVLFAVAVYAPLIANHNPIALKTTYGTLYDYYFSGWRAVHETLEKSAQQHDALIAERTKAEQAYEAERTQIRTLSDDYTRAGNDYDGTRNESNRLQDQIDALSEQLKPLEEAKDPKAEALSAQRDKLTEQRKAVDVKVRESGARKADLKARMDEHTLAQGQQNDIILRVNFQLDFAQHAKAIMTNLNHMQFPVNAETQQQLVKLAERYDDIFSKLGGDNKAPDAALLAELSGLGDEIEQNLATDKITDKLVYRWTFPALAALNLLDRFIMLGYPLLLIALFLGHRFGGTAFQRILAVAGLALVTALFLGALRADLPERNYKVLFIDNVNGGATESYALMPPIPYGYSETRVEEKLQRPSFVKDPAGMASLHLLGTDDYGRDVTSRLVWGARVSLSVGFVAVTIYMLIGIIVGAFAGFFGGMVDIVLSRFVEVIICFPSFFLILAVIAFIGPSIYNVMIVIGLTSWPGIARLTRGEFLRLRNLEFVLAAEAAGISRTAIMFRHVLPNALTPVMVSAAFGFAGSILTESGLSYLGFGVKEPDPSWGQMLSDSQSNPLLYWWLFIVPGIALFLTVTFYNLAGNALRDASDPRLRQ